MIAGIPYISNTLMKIENKKDWKFVVSVIGAVAIMGLGVVMMAAQVESIAVTQRVIGTFLVLNGLANIWYIVQLRQEMKKERKAQKDKEGHSA